MACSWIPDDIGAFEWHLSSFSRSTLPACWLVTGEVNRTLTPPIRGTCIHVDNYFSFLRKCIEEENKCLVFIWMDTLKGTGTNFKESKTMALVLRMMRRSQKCIIPTILMMRSTYLKQKNKKWSRTKNDCGHAGRMWNQTLPFVCPNCVSCEQWWGTWRMLLTWLHDVVFIFFNVSPVHLKVVLYTYKYININMKLL